LQNINGYALNCLHEDTASTGYTDYHLLQFREYHTQSNGLKHVVVLWRHYNGSDLNTSPNRPSQRL